MQFQIPQFIETESKIVGPLTLKQFAYVGVTGFIVFMLFFVLKTFIWIFLSVIIVALGLGLAFIKYNGRKLPVILVSIFKYIWKPKFYLWMISKKDVSGSLPEKKIKAASVPKATEQKVKPQEVATETRVVQDISVLETAEPVVQVSTPEVVPEAPLNAPETSLQTEPPIEKNVDASEKRQVPVPTAALEVMVPLTKEEEAQEQKEAFIESQTKAEGPKKSTEGPRGLGALWLKLSTTTKALTRRERKPPAAEPAGPKSKEIFEMFRKMTGEREVARRVDYR